MSLLSFELLLALVYLLVVGGIALGTQFLFYIGFIAGEQSRKLIHIFTALWMSTWRFSLSVDTIVLLGVVLCLAVLAAKKFKIFNSVFGVVRITYGEVLFVVGVTAAAFLFTNPYVYALAIINLGVADGLAAVIGTRYGRIKYSVFGSVKSIVGLLTSFTVVLISGTMFWILVVEYQPDLIFIVMHVLASAAVVSGIEFISFRGLDNVAIPISTGLLYSTLLIV